VDIEIHATGRYEKLTDAWSRAPRRLSDEAFMDGHVAPTEGATTERPRDVFHFALDDQLPGTIVSTREKEHSHSVLPSVRKRDVDFCAGGAQEGMRELQEDAGSIARRCVAPNSAAMLQVLEKTQRAAYDFARSLTS